jgi:hypothetical protein
MRHRRHDSAIVLDEAWRRGLDAADLETFERLGGALNRRLGYGSGGQASCSGT